MVAWHDSRGRVRQLFYANPSDELELTHVHNPRSGLTQRLLKSFAVLALTCYNQNTVHSIR